MIAASCKRPNISCCCPNLPPTYLHPPLSLRPAAADFQPPNQSDWRDTAAPVIEAMKSMTAENMLAYLSEQGVEAAAELQQQQREARELQAASRAALKDAGMFARTNEGRRTWQTILTAAAYDVDEGPSTVPDYRKAEILGVTPAVYSAAKQRARSLQPALPPAEAIDNSVCWFSGGGRGEKAQWSETAEECHAPGSGLRRGRRRGGAGRST